MFSYPPRIPSCPGVVGRQTTGARYADLGLTQRHKSAVVVSQDRRDHGFMETVSHNNGYQIKVFEDAEVAKSWLKGSDLHS